MPWNACGFVLCGVSLILAEPLAADPPPQQAKPTADRSVAVPAASLSLPASPRPVPRRYDGDPPPPLLVLRLPDPADPTRLTAKASPAEITARYLPPLLADPYRPSGARCWEIDLPEAHKEWVLGPFAHPAGKSAEDLAASCAAPPDAGWVAGLKASSALEGDGKAEPLPRQPSYRPFRCY